MDAGVLADPDVAVIVAVPSATDVTKPVDEIVATVSSRDAHVTVAPGILLPAASFTVAARVAVSPNEAKDRLVGDNVIDAAV